MKNLSKNRVLSLFLALTMLFTALPISRVGANASVNSTTDSNYGSVIGNTAEFNEYFPVPVADSPENVTNPFGTECEQLSDDETPDDLLMVIINYYYSSDSGQLWYKVKAAPGYELPEKLEQNPWVYQDNVQDPWGESLIIHNTGRNYVFDENGNQISSITFTNFNSQKIYAESTLQGSVNYQWQVYSDGIWIDIHGGDGAAFTVSFGMIVNILDNNLRASLRVVATSGSKTVMGNPITVKYDPSSMYKEATLASYSLRSRTLSDNGLATAADEPVSESVNVTVKFVYGSNGEQVADDKVYNIQKDTHLTDTFSLPVIEGYSAYLEDETETIYTEFTIDQDVNDELTIVFKYWPAKVNYTVIYYWQNAENDNYTEHERYTTEGFTGSYTEVEGRQYEGFYQLLYETVPIASDGSTVIEVYYDRLYYKMTFNLDGGYGVQPIYARYGTPINVSNPTKAGYAFVGWDDITNGAEDGIADTLPETIPSHHSAYRAIWKANDSAKVTIVYWGENANDESYSYLQSQELYVKPGTELTFGTNQLICILSEHTHGDGNCSYKCDLEAHTHRESCYQLTCTQEIHTHDDSCYDCAYENHTHNKSCYSNVGDESAAGLGSPSNPANGTIARRFLSSDGKVIYIDGTWYQYSGSVAVGGTASPSCGKTESSHTHTDDCLGCGKTAHTHTNYSGSCYTLSCGKIAHSHVADCYSCVQHTHNDDCYLKTSNMDSTLWTYVKSDTVTVAADGSTVMNVYYDRTTFTLTFRANNNTVATITEKWGASIYKKFEEAPFNTTYNGRAWQCTDTSKYEYALQTLDIMPKFNATFNLYNQSSNTLKTIYYYVENVGANMSENAWPTSTTNFTLLKTVQTYFTYATYEEEYHEMVGFSRYSASIAGFNNNSRKDFSNNTLYLYYLRDSFILDFNNGEDVVKKENVQYEANLGGYDFTPEVPSFYEPGSVKFAGWYLNPECSGDEYILSAHTMPAANLILYAKWVPVTHTVRFYLDETLERTDENVYTATVDGTTIIYKYEVPHGSAVQNPYAPPADPTKGQYNFVGWFYRDANGNERMWDFENTTVTGDTDIYAKWSSNTLVEYTVRFVYKDGDREIEIAAPITGSALGGNSKTFEAKGNDQLYTGYQEGYFPTTQSHTIVMDLDNPENNTYTFYYTKENTVPYTVYYVTDTQNDESPLQSVTLNGKTYYIVADTKTVADNKKAIVTETYVKVAGYLPHTYQQTLIIDPTEGAQNIIIFEYDKDNVNGMYVVHYWTENLDGSYSEHSIFEGHGEKGSTVTATIKDIENFTHDASVGGTALSGTISVETVLELNVYYRRNSYPYKVQYLEQGTNKVLSAEKIVTGKLWEEIVTVEAINIANFTLVGDAEKSILIRKDTTDPTVNIITFYYTENRVTINYVVAEGTGSVTPGSESVKILSGIANGSTATAGKGYRFVGWYSDSGCTKLLSQELRYVPTKEDGTKWVNGTTFYAKFEPDNTSLTIKKVYPDGADYSIDENQTFIFTVKGVQGTNTAGIDLTVTIHGNGEITITDLPIGDYVVTEQTDWSWRYDLTEWSFTTDGDTDKNVPTNGANGAEITLGVTGNEITFTNERTKIYWLDGDSYKVNIFKKKED